MASLTSLVVDRGLASMRQVEEALARQVLYGGDVASHLLEQIGAGSEAELIKALADQHGLRPAPTGPLPRGPESLRRLVPGDLAQRHGFYPLGQEGRALVVAVAAPLPDAVEADLSFALGLQIMQLATSLVRVRQGLGRDYDLPLERRDLRQLAKIEGRPDPNPSTLPPPMANPPLVRPPPSADAFFDEKSTKLGLGPGDLAPLLRAQEAAATAASEPPTTGGPWPAASKGLLRWMQRASQQAPAARARRRRGPMSLAAAEEAINQAATGDDAIQIFFEFSQQYFTYSALFVVHGDLAEGRDAYGPGSDRARVAAIGVPLDLPGCLALARNRVAPVSVPLQREGIDATLAADLGRSPRGAVVVVPVVVRQRVVALVYGDDEGPVELAHAAEVIAAASLTGASLERLAIARKRRQSIGQQDPRPTAADGTPISRPFTRSATLTGMSVMPRASELSSPTASSRQQKTQALARALGLQNDAPRTSVPPPTSTTFPGEEDASAPFRRITASFQAVNLRTARGEPGADGTSRSSQISFRAPLTAAGSSGESAIRPSTSARGPESSETPEVQVAAVEAEDELIDEVLAAEGSNGWPTSERASYHAPRMPPSERMLTALPSIIVDLGEEQFRLVERLISSDQDDDELLGEVLREGVRLVPALMARLPGPLRVDQAALERGQVRPSEAGPLLRAITAMRRMALPFVVVHSASNQLEARLYATLLLGEFPYAEAAAGLLPRFFDPEPQIPVAALASARLLQGADEVFATLTASLGRVITSESEAGERKKKAISILGQLGIAGAEPLIKALASSPEPLRAAIEEALRAGSGQELSGVAAWRSWLDGARHP
jgi:hypothetical protein